MTREELWQELFGDCAPSKLARFKKWHIKNPGIYEIYKQFAYEMMRSGRKRYGSRMIIERVRWHIDITTKGNAFKVSNDFTPLYARLLIWNHQEFLSFFVLHQCHNTDIPSEEERYRDAMGIGYDGNPLIQ